MLSGPGRSLPQLPLGKRSLGSLLREAASFLGSWIPDLRRSRDYCNLTDAEAHQDIIADAQAAQGQVRDAAYRAEQADLEAARLLRETLADGRVTAEEIPVLKAALRNVVRSADGDHAITEQLA